MSTLSESSTICQMGGFASISTCLCLDFLNFELYFSQVLPCASFMSRSDFPSNVIVGQ